MVNGFKNTEAGVIPDDWDIFEMISVIIKNNGIKIGPFGSQLKKEFLTETGYKVYGQENVYGRKMDIGGRYISKKHFKKLSSCEIKSGDFLISMMGTIGKCMIVPRKFEPGIMDSHLIRLRINNKKLNAQLLLHLFSSKIVINQINHYSVGGIMDGLSSKIVRGISIPLPPTLTEQTAIATALNDIDNLIHQSERLLAKKKNIKTGAMQELLRPKRGWERKKLGSIADVVGGGTPSTFNSRYWNGDIDWYTPTEVGNKKYIYQSIKKITTEGLENSSAKKLPIGTILLTSRASIGDVCILMKEGCTNQGFQSLIVKENGNNEFLYYMALTLKPIFLKMANGSTFLEINPNKMKSIDISLPDIEVQNHIAQVLSDMDDEIQKLEKKIEKYKLLKQGMMQVLLTGKIRLI